MQNSREMNPISKNMKAGTRKNAINAFCAQCMGCTDEWLEPGFRKAIRECTSPKCALYDWRPYQDKEA